MPRQTTPRAVRSSAPNRRPRRAPRPALTLATDAHLLRLLAEAGAVLDVLAGRLNALVYDQSLAARRSP